MRVGIDAQSITEVRDALVAHGEHYLRRIYTAREVEECGGAGAESDSFAASLAARFAAKEAVMKVLRVLDPMPGWTDIEVVRGAAAWPTLHLHGVAAALAARERLHEFELSLTHTGDVAIAMVVAT